MIYETVKKVWLENYQTAQPPLNMTREEWIGKESKDISDTINLLSSPDDKQGKLGMEKVGDILPFLLLGGFSKDEIIGYLKAKLEAGKEVGKTAKPVQESIKVPVSRQSSPAPIQQSAMISEVSPVDQTVSVNDADIFLLTLRSVLDPSLVEDTTAQQNYRTARDMLMQARQKGEEQAIRLLKLIDSISQREIDALTRLLKGLDAPQAIVDDTERRSYETMRSKLENAQITNPMADALVKAAKSEITPVTANKIRVMLIEGQAKHEPLSTQIMLRMLSLPESVRKELESAADSMIKTKNTDAFSILFMRLFAQQKEQQLQALKTEV